MDDIKTKTENRDKTLESVSKFIKLSTDAHKNKFLNHLFKSFDDEFELHEFKCRATAEKETSGDISKIKSSLIATMDVNNEELTQIIEENQKNSLFFQKIFLKW